MRNPSEYNDDLTPVCRALDVLRVPYEYRRHLGANPEVKKAIGYYPTGKHQIIVRGEGVAYSIIRGMASFGRYEIMQIEGDGKWSGDPERFSVATELANALKKDMGL